MIPPHRYYSTVLRCLALLFVLISSSLSAAVVSGTYTGNGSGSRTITLGFQPDVVMVQRADSLGTAMQVRVKGMTFAQSMASPASPSFPVPTASSATDSITGLISTGFTVGSGVSNVSSVVYYYLAFTEVAGEIKVGTYTGNGTDNRNITGLGFQPSFVIMTTQGFENVFKTATMAGELSLTWGSSEPSNMIQALNADGFQVGTNGLVNSSGSAYFYIACKEVAGKFKTGNYTGPPRRRASPPGFSPRVCLSNATALPAPVSSGPPVD